MTLKEVLIDASRRSKQELVNLASNGASKFVDYCEKVEHLENEEIVALLTGLWKVFVSADRSTTGEEYELFLRMFNFSKEELSYDKFFDLTDGGSNPEYVKAVKGMLKSLPEEVRHACCYLGVAIMASDREITDAEVALLEELLG